MASLRRLRIRCSWTTAVVNAWKRKKDAAEGLPASRSVSISSAEKSVWRFLIVSKTLFSPFLKALRRDFKSASDSLFMKFLSDLLPKNFPTDSSFFLNGFDRSRRR